MAIRMVMVVTLFGLATLMGICQQQHGFTARFWYGMNFEKEEPLATVIVPQINVMVDPGKLPAGIDIDKCVKEYKGALSSEYTAKLSINETGKYIFSIDGQNNLGQGTRVRFWVDTQQLADDIVYSHKGILCELLLSAGMHDLKMQVFFRGGDKCGANLKWKRKTEETPVAIPTDLLTTEKPDTERYMLDELQKLIDSASRDGRRDEVEKLLTYKNALERYFRSR